MLHANLDTSRSIKTKLVQGNVSPVTSPLAHGNRYWLHHQSAIGSMVLPRCLLLPSWLVRSGLRRAPGVSGPRRLCFQDGSWDWWGDPILPGAPASSTLQTSAVSPLKKKHAAAVLAVKYLQSILTASVGSSEQQSGEQREDVCFKR